MVTPRRAACVLLLNKTRTHALTVDREKKSGVPKDYGLIGGKVEGEETLINAARREAFEEAGIAEGAHYTDLTYIHSSIDDGGEFESTCFVAIDTGYGEPTESKEGKIQWVPLEDLIADHIAFKSYNARCIAAAKRKGFIA